MALRKNKITKISILVLMLLSLFLSVKYYKISDDFNKYVENSELENKVLESQLTEILHKYDSLSIKSKIDSLRFNDQIRFAQSGKNQINNSAFKTIEDSIVFYAKQQQNAKSFVAKLNTVNSNLSTEKAAPKIAQLSAMNVNAKGVKIYSDAYNMSEAKIQQLRVCFTLEENQLVHTGNKTVYIQVVNPKNQIISAGNTSIESDDNVRLQYSASVNANYQRQDTDVCTYVDLEQKKTIRGKYKINIYHNFVKIGTTIFEY